MCAAFGLCLVGADLALVLALRRVLDKADPGQTGALALSVLFLAAVFAFKIFFTKKFTYQVAALSHDVWVGIQGRLFSHVIKMDLSETRKKDLGDFASRAFSDSQSVYPIFSSLIRIITRDLPTILILSIVLYHFNPLFLIVLAIIAPLFFLYQNIQSTRVEAVARKAASKRGELITRFIERVRALELIQVHGTSDRETNDYGNRLKDLNVLQKGIEALQSNVLTANEVFAAILIIGLLFVGRAQMAAGQITFGIFGMSFGIMMILYRPFQSLAGLYSVLKKNVASIDRINRMLDWETKFGDITGGDRPFALTRQATLKDINFSYDGRKILKGADLELKKGELTLLVGANGSGKSTLAYILAGIFSPDSGNVEFDGVPITNIIQQQTRRAIGYQGQDQVLFNDTIENNLRYGAGSIDTGTLEKAVERYGIADIIARLPEGLQTMAGQSGGLLSGGERQRICLARTLLHFDRLLILDEITSNVDPESEKRIYQTLNVLKSEGMTVLFISHRKGAVPFADAIVHLNEGRIEKIGKNRAEEIAGALNR